MGAAGVLIPYTPRVPPVRPETAIRQGEGTGDRGGGGGGGRRLIEPAASYAVGGMKRKDTPVLLATDQGFERGGGLLQNMLGGLYGIVAPASSAKKAPSTESRMSSRKFHAPSYLLQAAPATPR